MVAPSCVGLAQHARLGNVDWRMAAGLAAGTALGSFAGSKVAVDAPTGMPSSSPALPPPPLPPPPTTMALQAVAALDHRLHCRDLTISVFTMWLSMQPSICSSLLPSKSTRPLLPQESP